MAINLEAKFINNFKFKTCDLETFKYQFSYLKYKQSTMDQALFEDIFLLRLKKPNILLKTLYLLLVRGM